MKVELNEREEIVAIGAVDEVIRGCGSVDRRKGLAMGSLGCKKKSGRETVASWEVDMRMI